MFVRDSPRIIWLSFLVWIKVNPSQVKSRALKKRNKSQASTILVRCCYTSSESKFSQSLIMYRCRSLVKVTLSHAIIRYFLLACQVIHSSFDSHIIQFMSLYNFHVMGCVYLVMKNHTLLVITKHALINHDYSLTYSRETHMVFKP